jgi:putative membrane protein
MTDDELGRDPRIYMAAERTFLAWIRTALALMAFGFVVARFAALVRADNLAVSESGRTSLWLGAGLIVAGIATGLVASIRHERYVRAIDQGNFRSVLGSSLAHSIVAVLTVLGIWMVTLLVRG